MTRDEHLAWCKERALAEIDGGDPASGVASMLSDLQKWDGGEVYPTDTIATLGFAGMMFCKTPDEARAWVNGFN